DEGQRLAPVGGLPHDLHVGQPLEQGPDPRPHQVVVVGERHTDHGVPSSPTAFNRADSWRIDPMASSTRARLSATRRRSSSSSPALWASCRLIFSAASDWARSSCSTRPTACRSWGTLRGSASPWITPRTAAASAWGSAPLGRYPEAPAARTAAPYWDSGCMLITRTGTAGRRLRSWRRVSTPPPSGS